MNYSVTKVIPALDYDWFNQSVRRSRLFPNLDIPQGKAITEAHYPDGGYITVTFFPPDNDNGIRGYFTFTLYDKYSREIDTWLKTRALPNIHVFATYNKDLGEVDYYTIILERGAE